MPQKHERILLIKTPHIKMQIDPKSRWRTHQSKSCHMGQSHCSPSRPLRISPPPSLLSIPLHQACVSVTLLGSCHDHGVSSLPLPSLPGAAAHSITRRSWSPGAASSPCNLAGPSSSPQPAAPPLGLQALTQPPLLCSLSRWTHAGSGINTVSSMAIPKPSHQGLLPHPRSPSVPWVLLLACHRASSLGLSASSLPPHHSQGSWSWPVQPLLLSIPQQFLSALSTNVELPASPWVVRLPSTSPAHLLGSGHTAPIGFMNTPHSLSPQGLCMRYVLWPESSLFSLHQANSEHSFRFSSNITFPRKLVLGQSLPLPF